MTDMETVRARYPDAEISSVSAHIALWKVFALDRETRVPRIVWLSEAKPKQVEAWADARALLEAKL